MAVPVLIVTIHDPFGPLGGNVIVLGDDGSIMAEYDLPLDILGGNEFSKIRRIGEVRMLAPNAIVVQARQAWYTDSP